MILYMYLNEIYFCLTYDLIYNNFGHSDYILTLIPSQWRLLIGTKISSIWGITSLLYF